MERLKPGDRCPLCGEPIRTTDPFELGYLTAVRDIREGRPPDFPHREDPRTGEGLTFEDGRLVSATEDALFGYYLRAGWDDLMSYPDFKRRFVAGGGKIVEVPDGTADG